MTIRTLPRRSFLRGLGGFGIALPALEIMQGRRDASAAPTSSVSRYLFAFGGISIGHPVSGAGTQDRVVPQTVGTEYEITRGLDPVSTFGVQPHVSIVSGLKIPWNTGNGIPAGGRARKFHSRSLCPAVCGVRGLDNESGPTTYDVATGPTSEWVMSEAIGADTPHPALCYRVQAAIYRGGAGTGGVTGRMSYRSAGGELEPVDPTFSPQVAFQSLFSNFVPTDSEAQARALVLLERRKSILDLVGDSTNRLMKSVGAADKQRLERHFDEVRALEERVDQVTEAEGACQLPADPGEDPPLAGAQDYDEDYNPEMGYSDEELRAEIFFDLLHMAFACDLSRSASVMFTYAQSYLNLLPIAGYTTNFHAATHGQGGGNGPDRVADAVAWHVKHYCRFIAKLRDTTDFDGGSMLDNTAAVLAFEGGHGYDPDNGTQGVHSTENMIALVAGHAGGLNAQGGQHVVATGLHPVNATVTAMQAAGYPDDQLGEVSGTIPELL